MRIRLRGRRHRRATVKAGLVGAVAGLLVPVVVLLAISGWRGKRTLWEPNRRLLVIRMGVPIGLLSLLWLWLRRIRLRVLWGLRGIAVVVLRLSHRRKGGMRGSRLLVVRPALRCAICRVGIRRVVGVRTAVPRRRRVSIVARARRGYRMLRRSAPIVCRLGKWGWGAAMLITLGPRRGIPVIAIVVVACTCLFTDRIGSV